MVVDVVGGGSVVVVVVVGGGGGVVVVVVVGAVVVEIGAVVVVAGGCVTAVAGARAAGVVVAVGNRTEPGSVETFDELAFRGARVLVPFSEACVGALVVGGPGTGDDVVVVLFPGVVGDDSSAMAPSCAPRSCTGCSSWCTTTSKAPAARRSTATQLHCSNRR